ncbi:hypothetical protein RJ641_031335 [Dillenia turbinata]|uniref:Uncharacterized protein n=1 Tax=Dillenia turbinata TaxID=194707 RepID=A0AAN8W2D3_9MAGN
MAGGGSRHPMFGPAGSRMSIVAMVFGGKWRGERVLGDGWIWGIKDRVCGFPVDEYYTNVDVMELKNGEVKWREIGDMCEEGERRRLGKIVVINDDGDNRNGGSRVIFMLDGSCIFRGMQHERQDARTELQQPSKDTSKRGQKDSDVPRKAPDDLKAVVHNSIINLYGDVGAACALNSLSKVTPPSSASGCNEGSGGTGTCSQPLGEMNLAGHKYPPPPPPHASDHFGQFRALTKY